MSAFPGGGGRPQSKHVCFTSASCGRAMWPPGSAAPGCVRAAGEPGPWPLSLCAHRPPACRPLALSPAFMGFITAGAARPPPPGRPPLVHTGHRSRLSCQLPWSHGSWPKPRTGHGEPPPPPRPPQGVPRPPSPGGHWRKVCTGRPQAPRSGRPSRRPSARPEPLRLHGRRPGVAAELQALGEPPGVPRLPGRRAQALAARLNGRLGNLPAGSGAGRPPSQGRGRQ